MAEVAQKNKFILIEDNPYGELRFSGENADSFSKVVAPGFRLGWVAAPTWIYDKLIVVKQAMDLHTSSFTQKIFVEFLKANDLDQHIAKITKAYGSQCNAMVDAISRYFPKEISITVPGGMFLWGRLPEGKCSMILFEEALKERVVFVPGDSFYTEKGSKNSFRLNYSCVDPATIKEGVRRLTKAIERFL